MPDVKSNQPEIDPSGSSQCKVIIPNWQNSIRVSGVIFFMAGHFQQRHEMSFW
jgi:hypothetical protein